MVSHLFTRRFFGQESMFFDVFNRNVLLFRADRGWRRDLWINMDREAFLTSSNEEIIGMRLFERKRNSSVLLFNYFIHHEGRDCIFLIFRDARELGVVSSHSWMPFLWIRGTFWKAVQLDEFAWWRGGIAQAEQACARCHPEVLVFRLSKLRKEVFEISRGPISGWSIRFCQLLGWWRAFGQEVLPWYIF